MKFFDNHTHSNFSPDSKITVVDAVQNALQKGLMGIAITDHYDVDAPSRDQEFVFNPADQQAEIDRVLWEMRDTIMGSGFQVMKGIEVGLQSTSMEKIKNFTSRFTFDTVIASIHFIDGGHDFRISRYQ